MTTHRPTIQTGGNRRSSSSIHLSASLRIVLYAAAAAWTFSSCGKNGDEPLLLTGIIDANTVRVSAQTPGIITELHFDEGTPVVADQRLATIETERLGYQMDQTRYAQEELSHQYAAAQAQLQSAIIQRDNIRTRYERFTVLLKNNAATQQNVDDLKAQLDAANEQVKSATVSLQTFQARKGQIESNRNVLGKQVKDATITAPLSGTVLVRYVEKGELVGTGMPVCEIADLREVWTKIYLAEKDLHATKLGGKVAITVDGLPGKSFEGTITWISDKAEFTPKTILTEETRTTLVFPAKVSLKNPDGLFKIGMPITVSVPRKQA